MWAKRNSAGEQLGLLDHLIDVAECFREIAISPGYARAMRRAAGRRIGPRLLDKLCVLAALHDIGKINPVFQRGDGGHLPEGYARITAEPLRSWFMSLGSARALTLASEAMFSHHGVPVPIENEKMRMLRMAWAGEVVFEVEAGHAIDVIMADLVARYPGASRSASLPENPRFWHLFVGLLTIADQIGSGVSHFPLRRESGISPDAARAVLAAGLSGDTFIRDRDMSEAEMFGWPVDAKPTEVQSAIRDVPLESRLILLESETGSGKTEAALMRFKKLFEAGKVSSLYFALPTRTSSVQIHRRVHEAVARLWGAEAALAVPGYLVAGDAIGRKTGPFEVTWEDGEDITEARWAVESSRKYLCSRIAVGTIDQVLMGVLRQKWSHMRASALSRSLLVVDEVHSSSIYMRELLKVAIADQLRLGGHVLIMSATLTEAVRNEIFTAVGATPAASVDERAYPLITSLHARRQVFRPMPLPERNKTVSVKPLRAMRRPDMVAGLALDMARKGGRILIIRNSVRAATDTLEAILEADPHAPVMLAGGVPAAHHSRFAGKDRKILDAAAELALGKGSTNPVIVIGTQTVEQSLDIDADYLITDICPIDVLLQRIGRLHRHMRARLRDFAEPACVLLHDPDASSKALKNYQIGEDRAYPDIEIVDRTLFLAGKGKWNIPKDNRMLVEEGIPEALIREIQGRVGRDMVARRNAIFSTYDKDQPIGAAGEFGPENGTREGEMGVRIALEPGLVSPFGAGLIRDINIPIWMLGQIPEGGVDEIVRNSGNTFTFLGVTFEYNSLGLRKNSNFSA